MGHAHLVMDVLGPHHEDLKNPVVSRIVARVAIFPEKPMSAGGLFRRSAAIRRWSRLKA